MNKAAPWSIKGVDFDARDAAREAARRAGMSIGEWLNEVIADQAHEMGVAFDDVDEEGRLEAVTARLASMSGKGRRATRRHDSLDDDDEPPRRRSAPSRPRLDVRETSYSRPARDRDESSRGAGNPEALLDAAIRAYERGASRGEQTTAEISKVSRQLKNIEHRLTSAFDEPESRGGDKYARLEARLEALAREKEEEKSQRSILGLERRLEEMAERIGVDRGPGATTASPDVFRIESKLNRLIDKIEGSAPHPAPYAPARDHATKTRSRDFAMSDPQRAAPAGVNDAIAQITRRQRELEASPHGRSPRVAPSASSRAAVAFDPALQALRDEVGALSRQIEQGHRALVERDDLRVASAPMQQDSAVAELRQEIADLNRRLGESQRAVATHVEQRARPVQTSTSDMDALRQRIDEMSRSLSTLAPRDAVASLDGAIRNLGQRVEESLRDGSREALLRPIADLTSDLRRGLADVASQKGVENVERAIRDLGAKIENGPAGAVDARAVEEIHAQTRDIRDLLQRAITRPAQNETIERQIARLTDRLDQIGRADVDDATRARALAEFPPIGDSAPSGMIELLAKRIDDLGRKIDDAVSQAGASDQLEELTRRIDNVQSSLARRGEAVVSQVDTSALEKMMADLAAKLERPAAAPSQALDTSHIEDMLKSMGARFDGDSRSVDTRVVEELRDQVAGLVKSVQANGRPGGDLAALEDIRRDMARLFELAESAPPEAPDSRAIADLRDQFGALAGRLDRVDESARALGSLETAIGELAHRIDDARHLATDAAETAARATIAEAMARLPQQVGSAGMSGDVSREIAELRTNQDAIDRRTYSTLTAVHETLEKVVDRIAVLEDEIGEPRSGHMLAVGDAPVFAPAAPPPLSPAPPRIPPVSINDDAAEANKLFAGGAFDELLEPGASPPRGGPVVKPSSAKGDSGVGAARVTETSKLIDAARRAAQASASASPQSAAGSSARVREKFKVDQAQADVIARARAAEKVWPGLPGMDGESDARPGGLARLKGMVASRRNLMIFVGIGALMVAGSWQLLGQRRPARPAAEVVDMSGGKAPQRADSAPEAAPASPAAPSAPESAKREGAALDRPVGQSLPTIASAMPNSGRAGTDTAPVGSIGSIGPAAAPLTRGGSLMTAAANGDPAAQFELGARYADGRTVARDPKQAIEWLTRAAQQNLAPAQYRLGSIYERGLAGERDLVKAKEWYKRAADAGNIRAMHNMAVLAAEGSDGKPDYAVAATWFRQAADYGVRDSQYNLAILYARGLGTEQSLVQSWAWFAIAAAQGDSDAAKKQEDVGARLDSKQLEAAKAIVAAFHPRIGLKAANDVAEPAGGWDAPARAEQKRDTAPASTNKPAPRGKTTTL